MNEKICILGQSNFGIAIILDILKTSGFDGEVSILPNIPQSENSSINYPFENGLKTEILNIDIYQDSFDVKYILGSIGKGRGKIFSYFLQKFGIEKDRYKTLIHPSSVIADTCDIGYGIHISPLSVIAPYAKLGNFVTINRNVSIGHHTIIDDFACINPGSTVAGICKIGENVTIGAGSTIIDKVEIGENSIIGAGSVVVKNIPPNVIAFGAPAKVIRPLET